MKKVSIIGSGSWGTALGVMLQKNGHDVTMWSRNEESVEKMTLLRENKKYLPNILLPQGMKFTSNRELAVKNGEIVIFAVPSRAVRQTAIDFVPYIKGNKILINVAKGLEEGSLKRLSVVLEECFPICEVCTLSGPSHAEEVAREIPTTCLIATKNEKVGKELQDQFRNSRFRLYTNTDVIGVELGAALKNIMALAAGMSDGLGFGDNTKAAIMTRGIAEMKRLGMAMGGLPETFAGLSGIGDLIVTCTSMHSRNRRAGILLGQGKSLDETLEEVQMVVEGITAVKVASEVAKKYGVEMPITNALNEVLFHGKDVEEAVLELMSRDVKAE